MGLQLARPRSSVYGCLPNEHAPRIPRALPTSPTMNTSAYVSNPLRVCENNNCEVHTEAHDLAVDLGYILEHRHVADDGTHQRILLLCHPHTSLCVLNVKDEWHLRAMDLRETQPSVRVTKGDALGPVGPCRSLEGSSCKV